MMRFALVLFALLCAPISGGADAPVPLVRAFDAMRAGDWPGATQTARGVSPVAHDLIEWHRLRAGRGTASEVLAFLAANPDWPGLDWLRRKSEAAMADAADADVLSYFKPVLPQTAEGAMAHARALRARGDSGAADAGLVLAWRSMAIGPETHAQMLQDHGALLAKHHIARLEMTLWEGWENNTNRMLPLVPEGYQKLARARMGLRAMAPGVDIMIEAVPDDLKDNPGLAYERFVWRARKGLVDGAVEIALASSQSAKTLGEPERWTNRRRALARQLMRDKNYTQAYQLASRHHVFAGSNFADLEWLSGYIALRFLNDPERALRHFEALKAAVVTPISLGRAGYWIGRTHEAMGNKSAAQAGYAFGAEHQSSFYGLLAAERAGLPFDASLTGGDSAPDWRQAGFMDSSVFQAAVLALQAGEASISKRFLTHLAESLDATEAAQLGQIVIDLNEPHIAVMIGKRVAGRGITLAAPYYAVHEMAKTAYPIATEFALAIARRESEFDPVVVSGAGARGLMQVMPATAKAVAAELGVEYAQSKLTGDWRYNAQLGTAYLAKLYDRFDGNPVMISAGYNAGPGRPEGWMDRYGDPRGKSETVMVDWIEHIPFRETRNYVMRVTESLPIYRARLGRDPLPVPFSRELSQTR